MTRYLSYEIIAIHALTDALFALINALVVRALLPGHWPLLLTLLPLAAFSWWGFFAEAQYVLGVSSDLRSRRSPADKVTGWPADRLAG
jgi:hypothetical protein